MPSERERRALAQALDPKAVDALAEINQLLPPQGPPVDPSVLGQGARASLEGSLLPQRGPPVSVEEWRAANDPGRFNATEAAIALIGGPRLGPMRSPSIRAYHSSPHDFERFDIGKVGTGQGAQMYGHGIYTAESPAVSGRGGAYDREFTAKALGKHDLNQAEERALKMIGEGKSDLNVLVDLGRSGATFDEANAILESIKKAKSHIYEVNINARPEQFLDWDKPLAQQPERLIDVMAEHRVPLGGSSGGDIYRSLYTKLRPPGATAEQTWKTAAPAASATLREAGIPGIRYLDQGSRGAGEGSSNYVVFNDQLIDILRKYGVASFAALPPAVQATFLQPQQQSAPVD